MFLHHYFFTFPQEFNILEHALGILKGFIKCKAQSFFFFLKNFINERKAQIVELPYELQDTTPQHSAPLKQSPI